MTSNIYNKKIYLGYYLCNTTITCYKRPSVPYRGVNRPLWAEYSYGYDVIALEKMRSEGKGDLANLWERYIDAEDELRYDIRLARKIKNEFMKYGMEFEIIYTQIERSPDNISSYPRGELWEKEQKKDIALYEPIQSMLSGPPKNSNFLGYDVAALYDGFHSAIYQPGLNETAPDLPRYLNKWGLFDDIDTAMKFMHKANLMDYGSLPFCVLGVWEVA